MMLAGLRDFLGIEIEDDQDANEATRRPARQRLECFDPLDVEDAAEILNAVRIAPVLVNLSGMEKDEALRMWDMLCGAVYAISGTIMKVSADVFTAGPAGCKFISSAVDGVAAPEDTMNRMRACR